jgi:HK97 family phage major capsid protein
MFTLPKFEFKGVEEISKMSEQELSDYKKNEQKYFDESFKAMQDYANGQTQKSEALELALKEQGEALAKMKLTSTDTEKKVSLKSRVQEIVSEYKKTGKREGYEIDTKTVSVVDTAEYFGLRSDGVSKEPVRPLVISSLFRTRNVPNGSGAKIKYVEQNVVTRGANNISFCSPFPSSDISFDTVEESIKKIADSIIVCKDDMEDYDFVENEVRRLMLENIPLKLDEQILLGTGTGLEMNSIDSKAQLWSVAPATPIEAWAGAIENANIFDLMRSAVYQIRLSMQTDSRFSPDTILINPANMGLLKSTKNVEGTPFLSYFTQAGEIMIEGATVKESILVPSNVMYVFDSRMGEIFISRQFSMEMSDSHANTFLEDKVTFRTSMKGNFIVRNQYKNAFLKVEDIDLALAAITKP